VFHTFQSTESRPFRKKQKQKRRNGNRKNIDFTLKTFVGVNKNIKIKYGTTLNELDNLIKKAYNVKNGVKLIVQGIQINKQVDKEQTIGDLIKANTQKQYTIYVVFRPLPGTGTASRSWPKHYSSDDDADLQFYSGEMKLDELKQMASKLGLSGNDVAKFGNRTLKPTYINAILASLNKEEEATEEDSAAAEATEEDSAAAESADSAEESADSAEEEDSAAEEQYSSEEEDETDASEEEEQYSSEEEQESEEPHVWRGTKLFRI
jgi:hypothetical protein